MASPTVDDSTTYGSTTSSGSHAVTIPNPCAAGKTLLMFFTSDDSGDTATEPSGWTALVTGTSGSSRSSIFYKKSNGSEGATATVAISALEQASARTFCIGGAADPEITAPEYTRNNTSSPSATPNPPLHTPSGGSDDYLYLSYAAINGSVTTSVYPTDYVGTNTTPSTGGGDVTTASCYVGRTASTSENPSAYTISASQAWDAYTVSITPLAAVGVSIPVLHHSRTLHRMI